MRTVAHRLTLGLLALFLLLGAAGRPRAVASGQASPSPRTITIEIDTHAPSHRFPHVWEQMFGSGRAILSLRADYQRDLRSVKSITNFHYVRFHDILDDDIGVYSEDQSGDVGGAIVPELQGVLADHIGIHHAFILPVLCYLYIAFFAFKGSAPTRSSEPPPAK